MIFTAPEVEDFAAVETALTDAFRRAQEAARTSQPIVFVLRNEHLLGQGGAPGAMLASALLAGMRTLAAEGHAANAVAAGDDHAPEDVQHWIARLSEGRGVVGELVHVGGRHVGKVPS